MLGWNQVAPQALTGPIKILKTNSFKINFLPLRKGKKKKRVSFVFFKPKILVPPCPYSVAHY